MHRLDRRAITIGALGVLVALAIFLLIRAGDDQAAAAYPATVEKAADWLQTDGGCPYVSTEAALLPVGAHGPPGLAFERFGKAPVAAAITSCEVDGGLISWYRFASAAARRGAIARRGDLRELFCVRGTELLIGETLGHNEMLPLCRQLGFTIHRR